MRLPDTPAPRIACAVPPPARSRTWCPTRSSTWPPARPTGCGPGLDRVVFGVAAALALVVVVWGIVDQASLGDGAAQAQSWVIEYTGWLFVLSTTGFVVFAIWVAASRFGKIPLGRDGERPEFRTSSWIAMMFSAGMGIGLMFWGVAEPLAYYSPRRRAPEAGPTPPPGRDGQTPVPLDAAPVGHLRGRRPGDRVRHLPPGSAAADHRRLHAAARHAPDRRARRQGHRHPGDLRDAVRLRRLAGPGRPADRQPASSTTAGSTGRQRLLVAIIVRADDLFILRPCRASPGASSGCRTSTWCWPSCWRRSSSSRARR